MAGVCLAMLALANGAEARQTITQTLAVNATVGDRIKVAFDRHNIVLETQAVDPDSVVPVVAAPLTVTAKARLTGNARLVLTVQADGPLRSGTNTIPINKLTWTMTGSGFMNNGTANDNAARLLGSWRGSGIFTGIQTYRFEDSWSYTIGNYTVTMVYTLAVP